VEQLSETLPANIKEPEAALIRKDTAKLNFQLWAENRWEEDKTFVVPHWLFWAAMCLREVGDEEGLAKIRDTLAALSPPGTNLVLQTAAVARDQAVSCDDRLVPMRAWIPSSTIR
jgi:hypothetical protein